MPQKLDRSSILRTINVIFSRNGRDCVGRGGDEISGEVGLGASRSLETFAYRAWYKLREAPEISSRFF